jgi:hypothetical protein
MKKIAILTLVVVLMLSSLGVGLAKWFDTITIEGTVETGSLDLVVEEYSGTWVYKCFPHQEIVIHGTPGGKENGLPFTPALEMGDWGEFGEEECILVAKAEASETLDENDQPVDDSITMTFANLFPNDHFDPPFSYMADAYLHYDGTIPGRLDNLRLRYCPDETGDGDWMKALYDAGDIRLFAAKVMDPAQNPMDPSPEPLECGFQLHYCDWIKLWIEIDIPESDIEDLNNQMMNRSGSFKITFDVVQWDAFVEPGDCDESFEIFCGGG